jgi:hypothetical protein
MKQNFSLFEISLDFLVLLHQGKRTMKKKETTTELRKENYSINL